MTLTVNIMSETAAFLALISPKGILSSPITIVLLIFAVAFLLCFGVRRFAGRWHEGVQPDEERNDTDDTSDSDET
jgi:hypothetical protein